MDSSRSGLGKWIYSGSKTVEAMVKEGKYKMINSSAYMRPDMARLIYAQWTIRVAYDAMQLGNGGSKQSSIITLTNLRPRDQSGDGVVDDIAVYNSPGNKRLQCVLYFGESDKTTASSGGGESKDTKADLTSHQNSSAPIDITRPKLPSFMSRSRVVSHVKIRCKDGTTFKAPLYDMGQLFNNHPQGLEAIRKSFSVDISPKENSASSCQWLGLVESEKTLPVATGLWKLVSILSKSESK
ncbi:hypothetical protein BGX21_007754 [Mortierella sp. AD011]|nr:hypothetical protein BGX20_007763 [Mortierella sp. AD010]KAF9398469.1 hypothetical protein BGX21_007754 [Mortierella sp. AD011]